MLLGNWYRVVSAYTMCMYVCIIVWLECIYLPFSNVSVLLEESQSNEADTRSLVSLRLFVLDGRSKLFEELYLLLPCTENSTLLEANLLSEWCGCLKYKYYIKIKFREISKENYARSPSSCRNRVKIEFLKNGQNRIMSQGWGMLK